MALISLSKVTSITLIASYISSKHLRTSASGEDFVNKLEKIHGNQLPKSMEAFGSWFCKISDRGGGHFVNITN